MSESATQPRQKSPIKAPIETDGLEHSVADTDEEDANIDEHDDIETDTDVEEDAAVDPSGRPDSLSLG